MLSLAFIVCATQAVLCAGWTWPNAKLAALDHARWDQKGFNGGAIGLLVTPCNLWIGGLKSGRANAADWIRLVRQSWLLTV